MIKIKQNKQKFYKKIIKLYSKKNIFFEKLKNKIYDIINNNNIFFRN